MVLVDTDEMCAAIKDVFEDTRAVLEPAGALAIAGREAWVERAARAGAARSSRSPRGANMNFDRLRFVAEQAELGEQREAVLAVTIPERPGSFRKFCALLGGRNVTEFNYRFADAEGARLRRRRGAATRARRSARRGACAARIRRARPLGQRDGEAARAPHGRRARAGARTTSCSTASSSRSAPAR